MSVTLEGFEPGRTFEPGPEGVVISLEEIIAGGREGVLRELRESVTAAEEHAQRLDDELDGLRQEVDRKELELARWIATRDAAKIALASAEKVLS